MNEIRNYSIRKTQNQNHSTHIQTPRNNWINELVLMWKQYHPTHADVSPSTRVSSISSNIDYYYCMRSTAATAAAAYSFGLNWVFRLVGPKQQFRKLETKFGNLTKRRETEKKWLTTTTATTTKCKCYSLRRRRTQIANGEWNKCDRILMSRVIRLKF